MAIQNHTGNSLMEHGGSGVLSMLFSICNYVYMSGAFAALLKPPAIRGLTESLTHSSPTEWRTIVAKLRRARLISGEDLNNPGHLDTHPLVREYFGEQLRSQRTEAWQECNRRLFGHYRAIAPHLPDSFRDMEP
jgi:hypothetical protein